MQRFALQEAAVAEDAAGGSKGQQQGDEGVEVEGLLKMPVQERDQCAGASTAGALQVKVFMDGALRIEVEPRRGKEQ